LKGQPVVEPLDPEINITFSAFIPESYIQDIDQRLLSYRRLARMGELEEIAAFGEELLDRYGPAPKEVRNLLTKIVLRALCKKAGIRRLDYTERRLNLQFSETHMKNRQGLVEMALANRKRFELKPDYGLLALLLEQSRSGMLEETTNILKEIAQRVNA
jgi:transcription-repair coupling factor (superfamily II helicase)